MNPFIDRLNVEILEVEFQHFPEIFVQIWVLQVIHSGKLMLEWKKSEYSSELTLSEWSAWQK
jgi:hypothetical protein